MGQAWSAMLYLSFQFQCYMKYESEHLHWLHRCWKNMQKAKGGCKKQIMQKRMDWWEYDAKSFCRRHCFHPNEYQWLQRSKQRLWNVESPKSGIWVDDNFENYCRKWSSLKSPYSLLRQPLRVLAVLYGLVWPASYDQLTTTTLLSIVETSQYFLGNW